MDSKTHFSLSSLVGQEITVEVIDVAFPEGWGIARYKGAIVFILDSCSPGDLMRVRVAQSARRFVYARCVSVEQPSPYRVHPFCDQADVCGGCVLQHIRYEKQCELKQKYLEQTLSRIGKIDLNKVEILPVIPSPDTQAYRNKIELSFGIKNSVPILGLRTKSSPLDKSGAEVCDISACRIFNPVVETIKKVISTWIKTYPYQVYDLQATTGFWRTVVVREGKRSGEMMIILVTSSSGTIDCSSLFDRLRVSLPNIVSLYWVINDKPSNVFTYRHVKNICGQEYISETIGNLMFRIYPATFFQPNSAVAETIYRTVAELGNFTEKARVVGLYCGSGAMELYISRFAGEVFGIDAEKINISNAQENCAINNIDNCTFYKDTVERAVRTIDFGTLDCVIIDPPRGGLGASARSVIGKLKTSRIIYVSCSPPTCSRDIHALKRYGFTLKKCVGVDQFPHTAHLEMIALLERN